jgi:hypothetical protein
MQPNETHIGFFADNYELFKCMNFKRFMNDKEADTAKERQYLERLYRNTYIGDNFPDVCVLDIEANFSREQKKIDMVLLNTHSWEIMFVEGKLFSDSRMTCGLNNREPAVIKQVIEYGDLVNKYINEIALAYKNHIAVMTSLFFGKEILVNIKVLPKVRLLVYEKPLDAVLKTEYNYRALRNAAIKVGDAGIKSLWVNTGDDGNYPLHKIWEMLY